MRDAVFAGKAEDGRTYTEEINVQQQLLEQMKEITEEEKKRGVPCGIPLYCVDKKFCCFIMYSK